MIQIPLTRGYTAIVDDCDAHLAELRWHAKVDKTGAVYARRWRAVAGQSRESLMLHREVLGLARGDGEIVDHINGDGLDNRRINLRVVCGQSNMRNIGQSYTGNASGYLGVTWQSCGWKARIGIGGGKYRNLGTYRTPEEANIARLVGERELWGIQPRRREAFKKAGLIR